MNPSPDPMATAARAESASVAPGPGSTEPMGRYLSRQRRLRGIALEELAELTKIPIRSLERLESGQFDGSSDGFVRGFVRTVADGLGLDVDDTMARMMHEVEVEAVRGAGVQRTARRWIALAAAAACVALAAAGARAVWQAVGSGESGPGPERVYWRDPVRALADATGAVPSEIPARPSAEPAGSEPSSRAVARSPEPAPPRGGP